MVAEEKPVESALTTRLKTACLLTPPPSWSVAKHTLICMMQPGMASNTISKILV
jgi:hypothetical protein